MENKKTVELVLGLIGGILGIIAGIYSMNIGGLASVFHVDRAVTVNNFGIGAIILSILGIIGALIVKNKTKLGGIFMIIAALGGLLCITYFYIPSGILLIIPGIMSIIKKKDESKPKAAV